MSVMHRITSAIESFKGLEKRRSDLIDKPGYFNELINAAIRPSGALNKRKGFHSISSNIPTSSETPLTENELGIASYTPSNELLIMNKNLKKVVEEKITVTNNSTTDDVIASFLPNEDNHLEYRFKSRTTGVSVDIGVGDESTDNPGEVKIKTDISSTESITVQVPAQTDIFRIDQSVNYGSISGPDDDFHWWLKASGNIFKSLDFRNGFSCFYAGDISQYGPFDSWQHFYISFTDGSYIYTTGDSNVQYRRLVYKDSSGDNVEKEFRSGWGSAARRHGSWATVSNSTAYYIKHFFSMGPGGYHAGIQASNVTDSIPLWNTTVTEHNGADWAELDFRGKTIVDCSIFKNNFVTNAHPTTPDVAAFGLGEIYPSSLPRTAYGSDDSARVDGTPAIEDCFKLNYGRFFLFGNGDQDVITGGGYNYFNKDTSSQLRLMSHGDGVNAVQLFPTGKYRAGTESSLTNFNDFTAYITYQSRVHYFSWSHYTTGGSNYFNSASTVTRVVEEATEDSIVDATPITTPFTINDLLDTINNDLTHVDMTAVVSDTTDITTIPAAYAIPFDKIIIPQGESIDIKYFREVDISKGDVTYNYFDNLHTKFVDQSDDFQNVSHTILNNSMYFATGFDEICKYDGNKIYRAGLPTPAIITALVANNTDTSSLNIGVDEDNDATTDSYYMITYKHEDANGNVIQSTQSATAKITGNTGHNQGHRHLVEVTIPTVQPGSGFNLDDITALIWRAPNTTTEDVLAASSFYKVTTGSNTSPTLTHAQWTGLGLTASNYVNVVVDQVDPNDVNTWTYTLNNNVVSNDKTVTSVKYLDFLSDADINLNEFITTSDYAEGRHDLPPKCTFITNHQGCLILAGTEQNPNELFYSLPEFNFTTGEIGSEYFPNNANSVIMHGANGTNITAVKTLRETLMVFNKNSISVLSGDITTTGVQYLKKDSLTAQGEQGTISSNCLQEWEGTLTFLSQDGILSTNTNLSYPTEMSQPIKPLLLDKKFDRKRAVSFFSADQDVIGFYLPVQDEVHRETVDSEGIFNTSDSKLFLYDVNINGWLEWSDIDMSGGVCRHLGNTFFISRKQGKITLNIFKNAKDISSYSDFNKPISLKAITSWDAVGDSSQFKKFIRLKVFSSDSNEQFDGSSFKINLYLRSNFDNKDIGPIVLDPGAFGGWGIPDWGKFAWGSRDFQGIRTKLFGKSKAIALHFNNDTINENILISGYVMEIASPYKAELKE